MKSGRLDEFRTDVEWVKERELEVAGMLVEALGAPFEPGKYQDRYRQNLRALLEAKIRGEELKRVRQSAQAAESNTPCPQMAATARESMSFAPPKAF